MKRFALILLLCLSIVQSVFAQKSTNSTLKSRLQNKLDSFQLVNKFPGITFAAILPNGEKISLAAGIADSVKMTPMKADHRMFSGSNGKTLFAVVALMLKEKGLFKLDDKIALYIGKEPWFNRLPNANDITFRQLMNHTSGIEEYYELGDFMEKIKQDPYKVWSPVETFGYVFNRKPLFVAGTDWGYADTNYLILAYILENISGKKMYDMIKEQVIKPYQLVNTEPSTKSKFERLATGYSGNQSPFPFHGAMVKDGQFVFSPQFEWAGGGFVSNSTDLAVFAKALYNFKGISEESRQEMKKGVKAKTGRDHLYGFAMQIRPSKDFGLGYGHGGWFPGYSTDAEYFPEEDIAIAIQFNTDERPRLKKSTHAYILELMAVIKASKPL
ncbi:serine hydrolase domain-containing protein [Pedobacter insulae]|uniref:D-alanyl-D-alanine carboxypeptidase n=1 Tax=Pedobacter insulae TaxID=414048 RepID=A0A1I2WU01_9SPHI|nr:serine hydrolase domain-containing protein [Pedobacter insulae]SFH04197.1 D-alanyl-D-alanine carboxypeptidase [Pedobacter insulae]